MSNKKINYLLNQFNVLEVEEVIDGAIEPKIFKLIDKQFKHKDCELFILEVDGKYQMRRPLFDYLLTFDPTNKLIYATWLLSILNKKLKAMDNDEIIRFLFEDLENISSNLKMFDSLKKKKLFKDVCKNNLSLHSVKNFLDINSYKNSEDLYDAVYPFLERDNDGLLGELRLMEVSKSGKILFEDKDFIVYTPLKLNGSVIFKSYANWCTARAGNTMFTHYTNKSSSINNKSSLYVIIRKSDLDMFQIHFETNQINNKSNKNSPQIFAKHYLEKSRGLDRFLYNIIYKLIKLAKNNQLIIQYTSIANKLGYSNILLEFLDPRLTKLRFEGSLFRSELDVSKFSRLEQVVLNNCGITNLFDSLIESKNLRILSLPNNNITEIPEGISKLKKLYVLNLNSNKINKFTEEIKELDPSNGGSLVRLTINNNNLTDFQTNELKKLLPNVSVE